MSSGKLSPLSQPKDLMAQGIQWTGLFVMAGGMLWGAVVLGGQAIDYLKVGYWDSLGLLWYVGQLLDWNWAVDPKSWLGLHALIDRINAGVGIAVLALLAGAVLLGQDK